MAAAGASASTAAALIRALVQSRIWGGPFLGEVRYVITNQPSAIHPAATMGIALRLTRGGAQRQAADTAVVAPARAPAAPAKSAIVPAMSDGSSHIGVCPTPFQTRKSTPGTSSRNRGPCLA